KSGDQIEGDQEHVDEEQIVQHASADRIPNASRNHEGAQQPEQADDRDVDQGAGDRDADLLGWLLGHSFEACHTADRQGKNVARSNAVAPSGKRMSQLVQNDTAEYRKRKKDGG